MSLYVYCVCDGLDEAGLAGARGLSGEPARLFAHAGLCAVVSPFDEAPVPVTREHVLAHNRVNAQVLAQSTPLPFRFGTLATEEKLAAYVEANAPALRESLAGVRGCVEMSVKLMWGTPEESRASAPDEAAGAGSGTAFLLAKRRALLGGERERRRAEELSAWLEGRTHDLVRAARARLRPSDQLVLRAAHLVERVRVDEYRGRLRALRDERPDLRFLNSGPWPPYNFTGAHAAAPGSVTMPADTL